MMYGGGAPETSNTGTWRDGGVPGGDDCGHERYNLNIRLNFSAVIKVIHQTWSGDIPLRGHGMRSPCPALAPLLRTAPTIAHRTAISRCVHMALPSKTHPLTFRYDLLFSPLVLLWENTLAVQPPFKRHMPG
jgi:hypothetical protein